MENLPDGIHGLWISLRFLLDDILWKKYGALFSGRWLYISAFLRQKLIINY